MMVRDETGDAEREAGLECVCRSAVLVRRCVAALRRPFGYRRGRYGRAGKIIHKAINRRIREVDLHRAQSCASILAYEVRRVSVSQKRQS